MTHMVTNHWTFATNTTLSRHDQTPYKILLTRKKTLKNYERNNNTKLLLKMQVNI